MDIVEPYQPQLAQKKFLLVATDYFSKWVEDEAYASIKDKDVTNNGQVEATNKTLITALKKRLEQAKGKWVEKLPGVLWAYWTTLGRPTGNTPFALAYGVDVVIPIEIGLPTIRTEAGMQDDANTELGRNLDWVDEIRETASIRMVDYQQRAAAHYNRKARPRNFKSVRWSLEREKIVVKITKRKALIGRLVAQLILLTRENRRDVPFDVMLLHAAMVAKEIHLVYLLLVVCLEFLPFRKQTQPPTLLFALINATAGVCSFLPALRLC
ncbi:hypothetical protein CK203_020813 [Vitis vinifera]|uniref:Integrase catalytic domain-containing protein n=1 Tax=Vitis vinifera TaxID=29760 RepID=A0A438IHL1_VITVI|nr:hypothetical protein CK203_020813 [Vitis vinifera]